MTTERDSLAERAAAIALLALLYALVARFGLSIAPVGGFATLVWPPSGIALAALLVGGPQLWPGVAIGAFVANTWAGAPIEVAALIAIGNTLEASVGAYGLRRLCGGVPSLDLSSHVLWLVGAGAIASTLISASIGVLALWSRGVITSEQVADAWRAWWLGDAIGDVVVAPLLLAFAARRFTFERARLPEAVALACTIVLYGLFVFGRDRSGASLMQPYLVFPLLIWAALRLDVRGVTVATALASLLAIWGTAQGHGPFGHVAAQDGLFELQAFMAIAGLTALVLSAAIAERRRADEQRSALYARAEAAVRARDDFLSIASHELRTPLSAVVLHLAVAERIAARSDDRQAAPTRAAIGKASAAAARLTRLVDGVLDVSRIALGRVELRAEPCDLADIVQQVVAQTTHDAERARCSLELTIEGAVPGRWDVARVEQILGNLLSNALKYGAGKPISITLRPSDDRAQLVVEDRGMGVLAEDRERIFARFERVSPRRYDGGLGLGLYITHQIVTAHGGTIHVTSAEHGGARFEVALPRVAVEPAGELAPCPAS